MQVTLDRMTHRFDPGAPLFAPVTATLGGGELVAVVGPSGAGKSTFLAILAGLITPTDGRITSSGDLRACWVTQNPFGVPHRAAVDHVAWAYLARGMTRRHALVLGERLLDRFGLAHVAGNPYRTLSGGQAQRLMLARAVAAAPPVLLVDEPTAQLDRRTAAEVDDALRRLAGGDQLVVVATHSSSTQAACDRTISLTDA